MGRPGHAQTPRQSEHDGGEPALSAVKGSRSELGRQVAVDLKTDADLHKDRCGPGHCWFPKVWLSATILVRSGYRCKSGAPLCVRRASRARVDSRARLIRGCICAAKNQEMPIYKHCLPAAILYERGSWQASPGQVVIFAVYLQSGDQPDADDDIKVYQSSVGTVSPPTSWW